MFKARPNLILCPNLPDRGVKVDMSWLKPGLPPNQYAMLEQANTDRPVTQAFYGIQARNLARLNAAGVRITLGTDGNRAWGPHDEMEDMVVAGMTPMQVIVAATRNSAEFLRLADAGILAAGKNVVNTALVSLFTGVPVRPDVAMTGEITLRGNVLQIGGVKEKLLAAHRAGIKRVIIPDRNVKDLIDVPEEVKKEMEILSVKRMDEVLAIALKDPPPSILALAKQAQDEHHPTA